MTYILIRQDSRVKGKKNTITELEAHLSFLNFFLDQTLQYNGITLTYLVWLWRCKKKKERREGRKNKCVQSASAGSRNLACNLLHAE